ncbi:hypothetical protein ACIGXF_21075 [Streptomyces sp. NPDC053086]|uniref:hypothetical protein n=1 Tax=unclassified Streptomyces TaxID=2593676 RepID=UPI0037D13CD7
MFDKKRHDDEPPVPSVPWHDAGEFVISNEERPATRHRKRPVLGIRAFRIPQGGTAQRVNAPCAFFPPPSQASAKSQRLFADAEGRTPLCSVDDPRVGDGVRRYDVRDGQGQHIGSIRRVAPLKHALKPTWRLHQPGHPQIISSAEWGEGGLKEVVQRGAGKLLLGVVQAVADMGAEGGDQTGKPRVLAWKADSEPVMTSEHDRRFLIRAGWLDRRLVLAYAMLRAE